MAENRDDAMLVDALVRFVAEKVAQEGEISLEAAIDRVGVVHERELAGPER
jgi:hypothetical protein